LLRLRDQTPGERAIAALKTWQLLTTAPLLHRSPSPPRGLQIFHELLQQERETLAVTRSGGLLL
jgi:hypothetical protein